MSDVTGTSPGQTERIQEAANLFARAVEGFIGPGNPAHSHGQRQCFVISVATQALFRAMYPDDAEPDLAGWLTSGQAEGIGMILATITDPGARARLFQSAVASMSNATSYIHTPQGTG
jgi:hypothetical protein